MVQENITTSGGNEGLYDCVLMDYEMPVLNGPNACEQIRDLGFDVFIVGVMTYNTSRQKGQMRCCQSQSTLKRWKLSLLSMGCKIGYLKEDQGCYMDKSC